MNRQAQRMSMLREVAYRADRGDFYNKAERLGQKAAQALTRKKRSQITGLEAVANSALKTSDVFDFIKTRTARDYRNKRDKGWHKKNLGPELLGYLKDTLREERHIICKNLKVDSDSAIGLQVHLLLIREFVRQLSAHYEYACEVSDERNS